MTLNEDFLQLLREQLDEEEIKSFLEEMDRPSPVSIRGCGERSEASKAPSMGGVLGEAKRNSIIPWCGEGVYLDQRPRFTLDPLFHAGAYYVQEASSMFISYVLRHIMNGDERYRTASLCCLDLCAAPGGKSTILINDLPVGSRIICNDINRKRACVLHENISKWCAYRQEEYGLPSDTIVVTNNRPQDFQAMGDEAFDLILCDVPCSGEGMFRKDEDAVKMWSRQNVELCQRRQREIVSDVWNTLRRGGFMIYSTCTYNRFEDEDNVRWICEELGGEVVNLNVPKEWNITGEGMYHFYPHRVKGEGFFCALIRREVREEREVRGEREVREVGGRRRGLTLELNRYDDDTPRYEVSREVALQYLHGDVLRLSQDAPKGLLLITYCHHPLGLVKNIGARANNLYPKAWRIRNV